MKNVSRRNFLKGIFSLPLAGLLPKGQEPELPGDVECLPESESASELPIEVEYCDYADTSYSMKACWIDGDGSLRGDWSSAVWGDYLDIDSAD